ncbi:MAG: hypothetical protein ACK5NF_03285 [Bacilli bacterium]
MPFEIECVQTDNGLEFTNRLLTNNDKLRKWNNTYNNFPMQPLG